MNQNERKTVARRMILLIAVACVIMGLYVMRLIFLQLVNGDSFKARATNTTDYNFTWSRRPAATSWTARGNGSRPARPATMCAQQAADGRRGSGRHAAADRGAAGAERRELERLPPHQRAGCQRPLYVYGCGGQHQRPEEPCHNEEGLGLQQYATADDVMEKLVEDYDLSAYSLHWAAGAGRLQL